MKSVCVMKIDVSRLVEQVQKQKLLFYPVMIHMLGKIMSERPKFRQNKLWSVYQLRRESGETVLVWQEMQEDAEAFLTDYAAACYENLFESGIKVPRQKQTASFGVFYVESEQTIAFAAQAPSFFLHPFEYEGEKVVLPLTVRGNFEDDFMTAFAPRLAEQIRLL